MSNLVNRNDRKGKKKADLFLFFQPMMTKQQSVYARNRDNEKMTKTFFCLFVCLCDAIRATAGPGDGQWWRRKKKTRPAADGPRATTRAPVGGRSPPPTNTDTGHHWLLYFSSTATSSSSNTTCPYNQIEIKDNKIQYHHAFLPPHTLLCVHKPAGVPIVCTGLFPQQRYTNPLN